MKHTWKLSLVALAAVVLIGVSGCGDFWNALVFSIDGEVIDAKQQTKTSIGGATVVLNDMEGNKIASATTDSSGYYLMEGVEPGTYELTGSKSGYAFISRVVEVNGVLQTFPDLFAVQQTDDVSIILTWNGDNVTDLDGKISVPPATVGNGFNTFVAYGDVGSAGFAPEDGKASGRTLVGYDESINDRDEEHRGVTHDVDAQAANADTFPRIETVTLPIASLDGLSGTALTDVGDGDGLVQVGDQWEGILEYSVRAYSTEVIASAGSPQSAEARVYVLQGTDMLGSYPFPIYTSLDHVSVLRIHALSYSGDTEGVYVIYPDLQILTDGWRSVGTEFEPIVTKRK